jgi:hypothetical protein
LIIVELHADSAWTDNYFSLTALAALIGQLRSGGFILRHGVIRMSHLAFLSRMAHSVIGVAASFIMSALVGNDVAAVAIPARSQLLGRW